MPSIGDTLREARMRQRLDIADVEAKTKIRAKYLRALENEEFGMLPGPTFVKTFLRSYAEVLGLDPHLLVEDYRARYEARDEAELKPIGPPAMRRERRRRARPPGPWLLIGLAARGGARHPPRDRPGGRGGQRRRRGRAGADDDGAAP